METDTLSVLHSAYTAVRSDERNRSTASITLDHLIQEQIDAIRGAAQTTAGTGASRLSKLDRLDAIERGVNDAVAMLTASSEEV